MEDSSARYPIAAVARLTGLSVDTIRAWERRYGLVRPKRDAGGKRRYDEADIARLQRAQRATERGHSIGAVAAMSDDELLALLEPAPDSTEAGGSAAELVVQTVLTALREFDAQRARRAIRNASLLVEPRELVLDVLVPLMHEVGVLWSQGDIAVWQEHLVSDIVASLTGTLAWTGNQKRSDVFLFATPPGELHSFGIAFSAMLASQRFAVESLGVNVPANDVVAAAKRLRATWVVIGGSRSAQGAADPGFFQRLERELPASIELWVGGPADSPRENAERTRRIRTLREFADMVDLRR